MILTIFQEVQRKCLISKNSFFSPIKQYEGLHQCDIYGYWLKMITFLHHNRTKVNYYKFKQWKKIKKKKDGSSKSFGKLCGSVKKRQDTHLYH